MPNTEPVLFAPVALMVSPAALPLTLKFSMVPVRAETMSTVASASRLIPDVPSEITSAFPAPLMVSVSLPAPIVPLNTMSTPLTHGLGVVVLIVSD